MLQGDGLMGFFCPLNEIPALPVVKQVLSNKVDLQEVQFFRILFKIIGNPLAVANLPSLWTALYKHLQWLGALIFIFGLMAFDHVVCWPVTQLIETGGKGEKHQQFISWVS